MTTFKKLFALLLVLAMTFTLFACNSEKSGEDSGGKDSPVSASEKSDGDSGEDFSSNGAAQAVKLYFNSIENIDTGAFIALMPAFDRLLYASTSDAEFESEVQSSVAAKLDRFEEECGSGAKFGIKVTAVNDVTPKVLDSMKELYAADENLADTEIGEGAEIEFDITVKGSDGEITGNGVAHVIQENGEWKIHNMNLDI